VLLGLDGKPAATLPERPGLFQEGFVPAMTELLHGARGERLAALAAAQRKALGVEMAARVDAAVKDLDNDRFRKREAASALLARSAKRTTAILLRAEQTAPSLEARRRLERLLEAVQNAAASRPNRMLPYGARWEEVPRDGRPEGGKRFLRFGDKD
jgi:hypothetical protein